MSRKLRPDERELWQHVAKTTDPLQKRRPVAPDPEASPILTSGPAAPAKGPRAPLPKFRVGEAAKPATRISPPTAKEAPRMDAKTFGKLKKGRLDPEGRLDLHGMTVAEAHPELVNFILRSHARGRRLVLVITGKGGGPGPVGPIPYMRGILRRQVPEWLRQMPLAPLILQVTPASPKHGGDGALYIYLRRQR